MSTAEDKALRLWFDAFDPAVEVEVTNEQVIVRSTRRHGRGSLVRCGRTSDLHQDLSSALAQLVDRMS
jgi:hypothetical protein